MKHFAAFRAVFCLVLSTPLVVWGASAEPLEVIQGERLDPSDYGTGIVESMDAVVQREDAASSASLKNPKAPNGAQGTWVVPSRGSSFFPHSGEHYVMNKWGDTEMGIRFGARVDVQGAFFAGQGNRGAWAAGIRALGYRDGDLVQSTAWMSGLGETPKWLAMDFRDVDRIVIEAQPVVDGAGWYGMDDLTYTPQAGGSGAAETVVLDFEDLEFRTNLEANQYGGLTWERGTGGFIKTEVVHPPQVPDGVSVEISEDDNIDSGLRAGLGTLPDFMGNFTSVGFGTGSGATSIPPDTCGAVGPNHFVAIVNRNLSVYTKTTPHTRVSNTSLSTFLPGSSGDPRILFDQHSNRWIILVTNFSNRLYLAVSTSDDPTGSWFKTNFVVSSGSDAGKWPDFPTLGVDDEGIYTSAYMVSGGMSLFVIDKAPLVAATPSLGTVTAFRGLNFEWAIQPAHTYGDSGGEYYLSTIGGSSLRVRQVTGPITSPSLTQATVSVGFYSQPPDAPALGSSVDINVGDYRINHTPIYRNGYLWAAHTISISGRSAIRWYQINTASMSLAQSGTVSSANLYYLYPHLAVSNTGDVVLGMSGTNASQYVGAYYTGRRHSDPSGEMGDPVQYQAGLASYTSLDNSGRNRWGDYSATSVDPINDSLFWTIQEYTRSTNAWGTSVAKLFYGDCNGNGTPDVDEIAADPSLDCQGDGILDECQQFEDCNNSLIPDECELAGNDCNSSGVPDECELAANDCNGNLLPDDCDSAELAATFSSPTSQELCAGDTAMLTISAVGATGYQWYHDGNPMADGGDVTGATTTSLSIANFDPVDDAGAYFCRVSSGCIDADSQTADLLAIPSTLAVVSEPVEAVTICISTAGGVGALFTMAVDDPTAVTYEWLKDGAPLVDDGRIVGSQTNTLEIITVEVGDLGTYTCHVENACGGVADTDPRGQLEVVDPVFGQNPEDACASVGGSATFTTDITSPDNVLIVWLRNGAQLSDGVDGNGMVVSGASTETLMLSNIPAAYDQDEISVGAVNSSPSCIGISEIAILTVGSGCTPCCAVGDVNCDGSTNSGDILVIRQGVNWNYNLAEGPWPPAEPRGDVNGDNAVNSGDILVIRQGINWNTSTGPCDCGCTP